MSELTHREKLEALLAGKTLQDKNKTYIRLNSLGRLCFTNKTGLAVYTTPCTCIDLESSTPVKAWYEEIPEEGIVCKVEQAGETLSIAHFTKLTENDGFKRLYSEAMGTSYNIQDLIPLTPEQLTLYKQLMASADVI